MRLPLSWLRDLVETELDASPLADRLVAAGIPVEGIERAGHELAGLVCGVIEAVERHPHSTHLLVARVDVGGRSLQVLTGAPNTRPGLRVAVAPAGVYVAGLKRVVQAQEMGGMRSEAVLLSQKEAGVGEDESGLWELPPEALAGASLAEALGLDDEVLEVEAYPNRPDWMGVVGLAREVAAVLGRPLRLPAVDYPAGPERADELCDVEIASFDDCPRYVARIIHDVPQGPVPWWIARRLYLAGMRTISPVVDVTNYVMLEAGQPLHAFDLERLAGRRIVVRRARDGERITTLDGQERTLDASMLVIADAERPQALAGLMGGAASEVSPTTRVVLLESATFHGALIRRTSRRLGLRTEASARFERGLPPSLAEWGSRRACHLLASLGARVAAGSVDRRREDDEAPVSISLRPERVNRVLGTQLTEAAIAEPLVRLGMEVQFEDDPGEGRARRLQVRVPAWRRDLQEEDDLAEEVARLYGYDRIPTTLPASMAAGRIPPEVDWAWQVRHALTAAGLDEVITYSFFSPAELEPLGLPADHEWMRAVAIANPLAEESSHLRTTLVSGLLRVARLNASRRQGIVRIFEVGRVFRPRGEARDGRAATGAGQAEASPPAHLPAEVRALEGLRPEERLLAGIAMMLVPAAAPRQWYEGVRAYDFYDLKGVLEAAADRLGIALEWQPTELEGLHPGRAARIWATADGRRVVAGWAGELHPEAAERLDLPGRLYLAELDLDALRPMRREVTARTPGRFPAVQRDLALLVPLDMPASRVLDLVRSHAGSLAEEVRLFDAYVGPHVPEGTRSLGITVVYRAPDRTLSDEEVDAARQALLQRLEAEGIRLR
ncbi:phenylalanine--tRNA ligase subunit beta [Geochorda subterranea]|uniref:Phenylalanine--tRNA ligase beta subunit n=1 Tax=Geochorda subterranea TaxID=3109564 RepID=A0ABZ1BSZ3_9FIRM|nr:phenylalanine--tRNA ligase subunit beta [Limnochorda sp. LNt]WRP15678.1 phenylalanine--tRNA ligase subunit beta [Limnochorda sp. LNt]